ncbi:MAG: protein translocase SEC61 complex subunit gamma [Candidatus Heimdallarchaeota archaeon]
MQLRIKERLQTYKRVLQISKKPSLDELKDTARICAIGVVLIGTIGFIIYLLAVLSGI